MEKEVPTVNRVAVVVQPMAPYHAWARRLDGESGAQMAAMSHDQLTSVYLIDELPRDELGERALRRHWAWIFEEQLMSWHRQAEDWPRRRSYKMFREWFDLRLVPLVFDLCEAPLVRD